MSEQQTVHVHLYGPNVSVEARQDATGRVYVEVVSGYTDLAITVASQVGHTGLYVDPERLANELEAAAKQLRIFTRPVDPGDHFIRNPRGAPFFAEAHPEEAAAHDATEAAKWDGTFDAPVVADNVDYVGLIQRLEDES